MLQNTNFNTYDPDILDNFPLLNEQDLQSIELKLKNDDIYKANMVLFYFILIIFMSYLK